MKITREEFKEYVELRKEAWDSFMKISEMLQEDVASELIFPLFDWMERGLGMLSPEGADYDLDIMNDLINDGGVVINCETDEEGVICNCERTKDLDVIYDKLFLKEE